MQPQRRTLIAAGVAGLGLLLAGRVVAQNAGGRVIPVVARKFAFIPGEITVKRGETVVLELTAPEVVMGINIPGLGKRADIIPGQVTRLTLTPQQAGEFEFLCDVFCGDGHEGMGGKLIVTA